MKYLVISILFLQAVAGTLCPENATVPFDYTICGKGALRESIDSDISKSLVAERVLQGLEMFVASIGDAVCSEGDIPAIFNTSMIVSCQSTLDSRQLDVIVEAALSCPLEGYLTSIWRVGINLITGESRFEDICDIR